MLLAAVIKFKPVKKCVLPTTTGRYVHGTFLNLIRSLDRKLADTLHEDQRAKPFTVSPIFGDFIQSGRGENTLKPENEFWLRFTSLSDSLTGLLMAELPQSRNRTFVIGNCEMEVTDICIDSEDHPWSGISSHQKIYDRFIVKNQGISPKFRFHILTPTMIHQHDRSLLFPLPAPFFYSILEKWDTLSNLPLDREIIINWLSTGCAVSRYDLKTRMWSFGKFRYQGFVGDVEFTDLEWRESAYRAIWAMLCHYAFWCGIGAKTTMGMGISRLYSEHK